MGTLFILLLSLLTTLSLLRAAAVTTTPQQLKRGFAATPDQSVSSFQPLLGDSSGNYSLGFLRINRIQLALAVIHVPSGEQLWIASPTRLARWSDATRLSFNGSLLISDPHTGVFWSSGTDGDRVWISNTSNVQIQKVTESLSEPVVLWQSFDFPSDTLMENQNFTSAMSLVSSNGLYTMSLGPDFIGFYAKFSSGPGPGQIYLKHRPLEAKAHIIQGGGPIRIIVSPDGFLGMYQNGSTPVDVESFNSFQQPGTGRRRIRLELDGNLKGYYWNGSSWVLDYQAIKGPCELPSSCGLYSMCSPGRDPSCSCIDNRTEYSSGQCIPARDNLGGDFCSMVDSKYRVIRRVGLELPHKELMGYRIMGSFGQCEGACEKNCSCWGAVYSNTSGFCYMIEYPIQTLIGVEDDSKTGYFKVRESAGKKKKVVAGLRVGIGLLCGTGLVLCGVLLLGYIRYLRRRRGVNGYVGEDVIGGGVGPYKDLGSASFKSIELSER